MNGCIFMTLGLAAFSIAMIFGLVAKVEALEKKIEVLEERNRWGRMNR